MKYLIKNLMKKEISISTVIGLIVLSLSLSSCSFKSHEMGMQLIQINLPQRNARASRISEVKPGLSEKFTRNFSGINQKGALPNLTSTSGAPADISYFNCYAVNVIGPGIPANPAMSCSTGPGLGIASGFVAAPTATTPATLTVTVPNGTGITFQILGAISTAANGSCPNIEDILAAGTGQGTLQGSPYILAQTTVDVVADATIDMVTNYTQATAKQAFPGCGIGNQGPSYDPVMAFSGYFSAAGAVGPIPSLVTHVPSPGSATDLSAPVPIPSPSIAAMNASVVQDATSRNVIGNPAMLVATGISIGQAAAFQLLWDASLFDTTTYPYGTFNIAFLGGQAASCATSQLFGAAAGVYDAATGNWIGLGQSQLQSSNSSGSSFTQGNVQINAKLTDLPVLRSGGKSYILVNVESNYAMPSLLSGCPSVVNLAYASLQLSKNLVNTNGGGGMHVGAVGLASHLGTGNTPSYNVKTLASVPIFVQGGTPPYYFTPTTIPSGGSVDANGYYTAGANVGTDTILVNDSSGLIGTVEFNVQLGSTLLGVELFTTGAAENADGTYTAGTCIPFTGSTIGYGGAPPTYSGPTLAINTLSFNGNTTGYSVYPSGACGTSSTNPSLVSGTMFSPSVFASGQFTAAGQYQVGINWLSATPANYLNQTGVLLNIVPSSYHGVTVTGPYSANIGSCVPVQIQTADSFGNPTAPSPMPSPLTVTANLSSSHFFSDPNCTASPLPSVAIQVPAAPSAPGSVSAYYLPTGTPTSSPISTQGITVTDSMSTSGLAYSNGATGIQWQVAAGQPTQYVLTKDSNYSAPDAQSCVVVDVSAADTAGTALALPISGTLNFNSNISGGYWGATTAAAAIAGCDTGTGSSNSLTYPGGPTTYYVAFKLLYSNSYIQIPNQGNMGMGASNKLAL